MVAAGSGGEVRRKSPRSFQVNEMPQYLAMSDMHSTPDFNYFHLPPR